MTIELAESRTELVAFSAETVCHVYCDDHWKPGDPMMCGQPDSGEDPCPDDCNHPVCSMCELEWERHVDQHHSYY
jgi:hypothetical protein